MTIRFLYIVSAVFFCLLIPAGIFGAEKAGPVDFTLDPILSSGWICYIQDGDLYSKKYGSAPTIVRSGKSASASIQSPGLQTLDNIIFIAWIEKNASGKKVLSMASQDNGNTFGDIVEISANTHATGIISFIDKNGSIYVFEGAMGEKASLYLSLSVDKGKTFKRHPINMEGISALYSLSPLVDGGVLYLYFSGISSGKRVVGVSETELGLIKVRDFKTLKETESVSFIEAFKIKDSPAFIYKTTHEGRFVLEGFVKTNADWEAFSIKGAEGLDVARMDHHVWDDGRIILLFSGEEKEKFKQRIYAAFSEDKGKSWDVKRIDNKGFDNTRSWLPKLAVDGDRIFAVWEDSRNIRSGVMMQLSNDRGITWQEIDVQISDIRKFAFRPKTSFSSGYFYIAWHQFRNDEKKTADIVLAKLSWAETMKIALKKDGGINAKKKEALLRERVNAYWKGMMKKDMKTTYMIHDPFYRAKIPYVSYASRKVPMVYHSYGIEGIRIEGNIATVKLKIKYDVPRVSLQGKEISIPMKEVVADDTYLFVDGAWYRKFVDALSSGSAVDY